jgi:hypothetical protein
MNQSFRTAGPGALFAAHPVVYWLSLVGAAEAANLAQ